MYKTILVPIDIEEDLLTEHALKHVEYLAKLSGAKVHFFHALPDASAFVTAYSFGLKEFENQAEVKAVDKLKKIMSEIDLPLDRPQLHRQLRLCTRSGVGTGGRDRRRSDHHRFASPERENLSAGI